jgi:hypothetical protein
MTPRRARNSRSYSPESPSESENKRGTIKLFTSRSSSSASSLASTRPERTTHASTYDGHPCNVGNSHAPQVRHTVHANVTRADAIGCPLAYADALSCLNAGATQRSRKALLELMARAVERMGTSGGIPQQRGRRTHGNEEAIPRKKSVQSGHRKGRRRTETPHHRRQTHLSPSISTTIRLSL